jgi:hypothetical protein
VEAVEKFGEQASVLVCEGTDAETALLLGAAKFRLLEWSET